MTARAETNVPGEQDGCEWYATHGIFSDLSDRFRFLGLLEQRFRDVGDIMLLDSRVAVSTYFNETITSNRVQSRYPNYQDKSEENIASTLEQAREALTRAYSQYEENALSKISFGRHGEPAREATRELKHPYFYKSLEFIYQLTREIAEFGVRKQFGRHEEILWAELDLQYLLGYYGNPNKEYNAVVRQLAAFDSIDKEMSEEMSVSKASQASQEEYVGRLKEARDHLKTEMGGIINESVIPPVWKEAFDELEQLYETENKFLTAAKEAYDKLKRRHYEARNEARTQLDEALMRWAHSQLQALYGALERLGPQLNPRPEEYDNRLVVIPQLLASIKARLAGEERMNIRQVSEQVIALCTNKFSDYYAALVERKAVAKV